MKMTLVLVLIQPWVSKYMVSYKIPPHHHANP